MRKIRGIVVVLFVSAAVAFAARGRSRVEATFGGFAPADSAALARWVRTNIRQAVRLAQPVNHYLTETRAESLAHWSNSPQGSFWLHHRPYASDQSEYYGFVKFYNDTIRAITFTDPSTGNIIAGETDPIYSAWADTFEVVNNEQDPLFALWKFAEFDNAMFIDAEGESPSYWVGVGTTTPQTKLHTYRGSILAQGYEGDTGWLGSRMGSGLYGGVYVQSPDTSTTNNTRGWFGYNARWLYDTNRWTTSDDETNEVTGWLIPSGGGMQLIYHADEGDWPREFTPTTFADGVIWGVDTAGDVWHTGDIILTHGSGATTITQPDIETSLTITLPEDDGDSDNVLKTDGAGVTRWEQESDPIFVGWISQTPSAPQNVTPTEITWGTRTAIQVTWTANAATDSVISYDIELWQDGAEDYLDADNTPGTTYTFPTNTFPLGDLFVRVRGISKSGRQGAWSDEADITATGDVTAPGVPTDPTLSVGLYSINIIWTNPTDDDLKSVDVWRDTENAGPPGSGELASTVTVMPGVAKYGSYLDYPGAGLIRRYYWIRAVDESDNASDWVYVGSGITTRAQNADLDSASVDSITIGEGTIADRNVGWLNANKITAGYILSDRLDADSIATGYLRSDILVADSITTGLMRSGVIDADSISTGFLSADRIAAESLTLSVLSDAGDLAGLNEVELAQLGETVIIGGYLRTGLIDADSINTGKLSADHIDVESISIGSLDGAGALAGLNEIDLTYVTDAGDLASLSAVEVAQLGETVITGGYLRTGLIDADSIATGTLSADHIDVESIAIGDLSGAGALAGMDDITLSLVTDSKALAGLDTAGIAQIGGTVILGGKIRTDLFAADSIFANDINVKKTIVMGDDGTLTGIIRSYGKATYGAADDGFWLGFDGGTPKFDIGDDSEYMRWTGDSLVVKGRLDASDLTTGDLDTLRIPVGSIGSTRIKEGSIDSVHFEAGSVRGETIPALAITETHIAEDAISTPKLQANSIIGEKVATHTLTTDKIILSSPELTSGTWINNTIDSTLNWTDLVLEYNGVTYNLRDGDNVVTNGGFETGDLTGWLDTGGTNAASDAEAHTGTYSVHCNNASSSHGVRQINLETSFSPGDTFIISVWVKVVSTDESSDGIRAMTNYQVDEGTDTYNLVGSRPAVGDWTLLTETVTLPTGTTLNYLRIYLVGIGEAYWDDVTLHNITSPTATSNRYLTWFDGDSCLTTYAANPELTNDQYLVAINDYGVGNVAVAPFRLLPQSVGTIHIEDLSITNAKVDSLNANKITAGYLDAARIAAESLTLGVLSDAGALAALDTAGVAQLGETLIIGGYLRTGLVDADSINAGILTGRTVRTAASGKRVVIDGPLNQFKMFNAAEDSQIVMDTGADLFPYEGDVGETQYRHVIPSIGNNVLVGDVNQDERVTHVDWNMILKHVVQKITLTGDSLNAADVSNNGIVSAYDAALIQVYVEAREAIGENDVGLKVSAGDYSSLLSSNAISMSKVAETDTSTIFIGTNDPDYFASFYDGVYEKETFNVSRRGRVYADSGFTQSSNLQWNEDIASEIPDDSDLNTAFPNAPVGWFGFVKGDSDVDNIAIATKYKTDTWKIFPWPYKVAIGNATNSTLTRTGSGTRLSPYTLALNLGNANTWTAKQTFNMGVESDSTITANKGITFDPIPTYDNGGTPNPPTDANCAAAYPAAATGFMGPMKDENDSKIYMVLRRGSGDWVYWSTSNCP